MGLVALLLLLPSLASAQITGQGFQVQNHGAFLGHAGTLNCGTNITCVLVGGIVTLNASGGGGGTVTGSGTTGFLPIWTNGPGSVLGDSLVSQSGGVVTVTGSLGVTTANTHTGVLYVDGSGHLAAGGDGSGALQFSYVPGAGAANGSIDFSVAKAITTPDDGDVEQTGAFFTAYIDHLDAANHPNTYGAAIFEGDHIGTGLVANMKGSTSTASTKNGNVTALYGSLHQTLAVGSGNITGATSAVALMPANSGSGTITTASGLLVENGSLINPSTGIITNMYGVKINAQTGPTVTNQYGLWIGDVALGGTISRAIQTGAGDILLGTLAGSGTRMVTASSTGVLSTQAIPTGAVTSVTGTSNQITASPTTGAVILSLPSAVTMPGSLTVTTRTGTPATMAVFTSGGVLAETTLPSSGTVTSIATTSPITGGTITTTGTIACATCVTAASALTSGHLVAGAGGQATAITDLTGDATTSGGVATTVGKVNGVTYPASPSTNTVPVVTGTNTITYEAVPNAALANSSVTVNGTTCTLGSSCTPASTATTVISWSNAPIPADWGAQLLTMSSTLTVRYAQYVQIPYAITVNQITVAFGPVTTPGTFKECVYSADGSSKLIDITVTPVAASLVSGAVSAVTIGPGSFWFVIGGATTNSGVQIRSATTEAGVSSFGTAARPSGKTVWHGTVSHTSGTCNTTLGTVTASGDVIPNFFFDN